MSLPITRVTLYKHGLGFFQRRGQLTGDCVRLEFPRSAMDDILKSLVVQDAVGQVQGVEFETPPDRNEDMHRPPLRLGEESSLTDALTALRGRHVRVSTGGQEVEGVLMGVDLEQRQRLERALLSVYQSQTRRVVKLPLSGVDGVEILDAAAAGDLEFALSSARRDADRAEAVLRLSAGEHDLMVSYIAPAPAWRVSYRLLSEGTDRAAEDREVFLQGWGVFDNTLEEDLEHVQLSLVAGMPVSFRYALFAPNTPERPLVQDEERTVTAPMEYATMAPASRAERLSMAAPAYFRDVDSGELERSAPAVASGEDQGALFSYNVTHPVSVARGQSGMVPLLAVRLGGRRELLYSKGRHPGHPVASLRFTNTSGLTLERGPVTVLEDGGYAGEAVLAFTPAGAEIITAFAVELGVRVLEHASFGTQAAGLSIEKGYLLLEEYRVRSTVYEVTCSLDRPVTLSIEHPLELGAEVFDTPDAEERGADAARWRLTVTPRGTASLTVRERTRQRRREEVRSLNFETLSRYLKERALDAATVTALKDIRVLYDRAEQANAGLQALDQERERIFKRQGQIQSSLAPLGQSGEEGRLRARLVRELGEFEDRLDRLDTEAERLREQARTLKDEAQGAMQALEP